MDEWGYVSLDELAALRVAGTVPRIEIDRHFEPMPFSEARAKYAGCFRG